VGLYNGQTQKEEPMQFSSKSRPLTEAEMEAQLAAMQIQITQMLAEVKQSNDASEERWRSIESQQAKNVGLLAQIEARFDVPLGRR